MPKESFIVSRSGMEYKWNDDIIRLQAKGHITAIYVNNTEMAIAVRFASIGFNEQGYNFRYVQNMSVYVFEWNKVVNLNITSDKLY